MILCSPVVAGWKIATDPVVVFEILSDSTAHIDLIDKNAEYRATASIERYVVLERNRMAALIFSRKGEDWVADVSSGGESLVRLPEVGIEFSLAELYLGVAFETVDAETDGA